MKDGMKRALPLLGSVGFLILNLLFFTPFDIYRSNLNEFSASLPAITRIYALAALALALALVAVGWLLPRAWRSRYVSLLFAIGILTWVQGNFLTWEYGRLEGVGIDWTQDRWRGWVDGALWVALLSAALVFHRKAAKLAAPVSAVLIGGQLALIVVASLQHPQTWSRVENELRPPEPIFQLSSQTNVIHVIFDAFPSYALEEIIAEQPERYRRALEGFILFREAVGAFPTTQVSVPAFMNGAVYRNHMPMPDFLDQVMGGQTITNLAYENGYEVDFIDRSKFFYGRRGSRYTHFYSVPVPYEQSQSALELRNASLMLDLVLFRSAPHVLKRYVYNNQLWLLQRRFSREPHERFVVFAHRAFLADFIDRMSVAREKPVYKLMHFFHTHGPLVVDEDGGFVGEPLPFTRDNAMPQYRAAVAQFVELLEGLRALGVYDSSLIVLHADHGQRIFKVPGMATAADDFLGNVVSAALPAVLIKPPHRHEPFEVSAAPVALTDLPATIDALLGLGGDFAGVSMLELEPGQSRARTYHDYEWVLKYNNSDYMDWIEEYRVDGSVFDRASWRSVAIHRPGQSAAAAAGTPTPETPVYALDRGGGRLTASGGTAIEVQPEAMAGRVDVVETPSGRMVISGWAVDLEAGEPPRAIVVFANGALLHAGRADRKCPNRECRTRVNESRGRYGNAAVGWAGFRFDLPRAQLDGGGDASALRVFAISTRGVATELERSPADPEQVTAAP